ncbi:TSUP family transporter [Arthrobacter sp. CJ23]|uniref:sulfite exporter TauE/SafE family protein n=1 Tax=Arthrobacter sp. CJ23 TaxID=2972479 RepID=UPI00215C02DA|nr:TSUP family transporter [Arthrobacter sp. CJ23]UVJ40895.1 TSUP family transporter [Arthrobacter sp. CJ23]
MISGFESIQLTTLILIVVAGFAAGWVDAVVGGGGLIQLPALLLVPGITPVQALATNKMGSIFGTTTSAVTYYRRVGPDLKTAVPMAVIALAGSFGGAVLAANLPASVFKPIIVVALVAVALFTALRPNAGELTALRHDGHTHYIVACLIGAAIGFYDGLIGPGTGSFLVIALVSAMGYAFLEASAKAKIVNMATNAGALIFFLPHGSLLWGLGLVLGLANMAGGYLGARTAVKQGSSFVRIVFLIVVAALIVKLGYDVWQDYFGA